jgi:hypothetical protein
MGNAVLAATAVTARNQLRGHLPELGERPTTRVFVTQAAYDTYRTSLGDANVFPAASSLFMSFDKDILALYTRGNDTGGRCIASTATAVSSGDTATVNLQWQPGTCGAPSGAHYPFILVSLSRTAADGTSWLSATRQICAVVDSADTNACATLAGASPAPSPTATTPSSTATASAAASATTPPTATRSLTPSQTVAVASPTPTVASAVPSASRSPVAVASPPAGPVDSGPNVLLYAMLIAIAFLVLLSLFLSRGGRRR